MVRARSFIAWTLAACLAHAAAAAPAAAERMPTPDALAVEAALAPVLDQAFAEGFSGSVLVASGDRVLFERSAGLADPEAGTAVTPATRFNLASTGKLFTTVAVLQLVQAGKLDLDAPLGRYLPDWPVATVREQVTARQLLLHTSGLGSYWGTAFTASRPALHRLADYRPLLAREPAFAPGSRWQYSNIGFQLLGLLVEQVSGEDYYDYVRRHVFAPAGMEDSGYFDGDGVATGVARPVVDGAVVAMPEPRGGAAGGGYSTPRDLWRFHRALVGGRLLDAPTLALFFSTASLPAGTRAPPHGLGTLRYAVGEDVAYGHPGGAPGVGVEFRGLRDAGWVVAVMSNSDTPRTMPLAHALMGRLAETGAPDLRPATRPTIAP